MPPKKNAVAARIKKLMQADDDVGKIAQATPVLMAKALDLFLEELMRTTTEIASYHGAKTVSAGHLRASIMGNEKFDFLKEIVEGVPDLPTEQVKKPVVGSLSEGDEVRVMPASSSLSAGRLTGEATTTTGKRDRPQKAPAPEMNVGEDDEPALKAMRGTGSECGQRVSLEEGVIGLGSSFAQVVGTLAEDDDYDDL